MPTSLLRKLTALLFLTATLALADSLPPPPELPPDTTGTGILNRVNEKIDQETKGKTGVVDGRTLGMLVVQVLLSLSVVTGLGFGALFAWSKLQRRAVRGQSGIVDVLETRTLAPGKSLHLVRLHNRVVAVVTTSHGVAPVGEFRDNEAAEIIAELGAGSVSTRDFSAALDTLLDRFRKPGSQGGA